MQTTTKFYYPLQGSSDAFPPEENRPEDKKFAEPDNEAPDATDKAAEVHDDNKSNKTSLRDALQEWSNDNERDIEEDDAKPLRSGL